MSKAGPVLGAVAGVLLVVGGVAAAQAFKPAEQPTPHQSVVQPVVDVPEVTTTTTAPEPAATTAKPKPVKKKAAPVESAPKASTSAPQTVQRQAVVSDENTEPEPNATLPGRKTRPNPGRPVGPVVIDPQNPAPDPQ